MTISSTWYLENKKFETWAYIDNFLTKEECEKIKEISTKYSKIDGKVETGIKKDIRQSEICFFNSSVEEEQWIYRKLTDAINTVNKTFWEFDLDYIETLQYTEYNQVGHRYKAHLDVANNFIHYRKLSFTVQLDDPNSYEGGDFVVFTSETPQHTLKSQGSLIIFPSFILHEVTPIENGSRSSLVGWVCGPSFK